MDKYFKPRSAFVVETTVAQELFPCKITAEIFENVVLPICYGTKELDRSMWKIESDEAGRLHDKVSSSKDFAMGATNKNLTYGEVVAASIQHDVLPAFALPDELFREAHIPPASPLHSSPLRSTSPLPSPLRSSPFESSPRSSARSFTPTFGRTRAVMLTHQITAAMDTSQCLKQGDVFYDLGSGTGKIPLQVALQCPGTVCKGIEFARARHDVAVQAYAALKKPLADLETACAMQLRNNGLDVGWAASLARQLHDAGSRLEAIEGSFLDYDYTDATVIFINNTVFEAPLMNDLKKQLAMLPKLRRLVVLRSLCGRHGSRCVVNGEACAAFAHPPIQGRCTPTWCPETTIFTYATMSSLGLHHGNQLTLDTYLKPPVSSGKRRRSTPKMQAPDLAEEPTEFTPRKLFSEMNDAGGLGPSPNKRPRPLEPETAADVRVSPVGVREAALAPAHKFEGPRPSFAEETSTAQIQENTSPVDPFAPVPSSPKAGTSFTPRHTPSRAPPRTPARPPSGRKVPQVEPTGPAVEALHNLTVMSDKDYAEAMSEGIAAGVHISPQKANASAADVLGSGYFPTEGVVLTKANEGIGFASPSKGRPARTATQMPAVTMTPARLPRPPMHGTPAARSLAENLLKTPASAKKSAVRMPNTAVPITPARLPGTGVAQTPSQAKAGPVAPDSPFYTKRRSPRHPSTVDIHATHHSDSESSEDAGNLALRASLGKKLSSIVHDDEES